LFLFIYLFFAEKSFPELSLMFFLQIVMSSLTMPDDPDVKRFSMFINSKNTGMKTQLLLLLAALCWYSREGWECVFTPLLISICISVPVTVPTPMLAPTLLQSRD
jgi:hypothetical protein